MNKIKVISIFSLIAVISFTIGAVSAIYIFKIPLKNDNPADKPVSANKVIETGDKKSMETKKQDDKPKHLDILSECLPDKFGMKWDILSGSQNVKDFSRSYDLSFGDPSNYSVLEGVTCFRGNNYRSSASFGHAEVNDKKLEKVWSIKNGYIDTWTGTGWTGQPAIVKWSDETRRIMNISASKKDKSSLKEVIYVTLDGKIYFLDLDDGIYTRQPINIGSPHKGSLSVDPRGYPLLYTGQGIEQVKGKLVPTGYRIFNLIDQKMLYFIDGYDPFAFRKWPAFDSNGLLNSKTDTFVECGENGVLYTMKLNTNFNPTNKSIKINPEIIKYRYTSSKSTQLGTENSPAFYKNFIYFVDNSGLLQCVDLNTMKPVWARYVTDDSDSSIGLEANSDTDVSLYTACEVDKQGSGGSSFIRKINALTGELLWEKSYKCFLDTNTNGGALASPVIGKHEIDNIVIYNIAKTGTKTGGKLVALDKKTGNEVWTVDLKYYCWSSPVDVYTKEGSAYLIVCDSAGFMLLLDAKTGTVLDKISLGGNIEASPAVYENMVVVGTRGQRIFGIKIK